jgi:hypothetical protein
MPRTELSEPEQSPRELDRTGGRFRDFGGRFALLAVVMAVVGALLIVLADGVIEFFGVVLASLAILPGIIGIGLLLSALVAKRAAKGRSFA